MRGQGQAAQRVPARPPFPDLRHDLVAEAWRQRHPRRPHPQVLTPLDHALRSSLREGISSAQGRNQQLKKRKSDEKYVRLL